MTPKTDDPSDPGFDREIRLSEVLSALSYAIDLTEGQPIGHSVRTCLIGTRLADACGITADRSALFYALLMKDLGCSSNAARVGVLFGTDDFETKRQHKLTDWPRRLEAAKYVVWVTGGDGLSVGRAIRLARFSLRGEREARALTRIRCERGAEIAAELGFPRETADAIRALDEHWNGRGHPFGLRRTAIPLFGRILCLAQTVEVFFTAAGLDAALDIARQRSGRWFDPELVRALDVMASDTGFWSGLRSSNLLSDVVSVEPEEQVIVATEERLNRVAEAFARVIDAKSPWTFRHSERVAEFTVGMAEALGYRRAAVRDLRWAALLHDIGKLGVPNTILDKHGPLSDAEWGAVKRHPRYTVEILDRVAPFRRLAATAGAHHERLDGSGYHRGLTAVDLSQPARILAAVDVFEALSATRPYRQSLGADQVLGMMDAQTPARLCPDCVAVLSTVVS